jgi:hypothetical protein
VLPLDLIYVAFGLLLAGIARRIPAFAAHYHNDKETDFAGVAFCIMLFVCACLLTWIDRLIRLLWQKFYSAWNLAKEIKQDEQQLPLPEQPAPIIGKIAVIYLWMFTYWAIMIPLVFIEVVVSVEALGAILQRLQ